VAHPAAYAQHLFRTLGRELRREYATFALERRLENAQIERPFSVRNPQLLSIGPNVKIHRNCHFHCGGMPWSGGRGGITMGTNCNVQENAVFYGAGGIEIGDYTGFGPGVMIFSSREDFSMESAYLEWLPHRFGKVTIGDRVRVNANVVIGPGVTIGDGVVVGAGAVVLKDLPAWTKVAGVPARVLGERDEAPEPLAGAS
jgi:acetyltransferase-like isoleucine patch superfamily enzyme